jgi:NlpC/P60 family
MVQEAIAAGRRPTRVKLTAIGVDSFRVSLRAFTLAAFLAIAVAGVGLAQAPPTGYEWARPAAERMGTTGVLIPGGSTDLGRPATRRELARGVALVLARRGITPTTTDVSHPLVDVAATDPDHAAIALSVRRGLLRLRAGSVSPDAVVTARETHRAMARALGLGPELGGLARIATDDGARLKIPPGFAAEVLVRELGLRHNYLETEDGLERTGIEPLPIADLAAMVDRAASLEPWRLAALAPYRQIALPAMTPAQRTVVEAALAQVGHPYVWAGDWPTVASPWGAQAHGGFDCSGLVWMAFKGAPSAASLALGTAIRGRTADDMAREAPAERVEIAGVAPGDLVFFGARGAVTARGAISHAGLSLGNRWMIHSSGSRAGVSISNLDTYWPAALAWGRRLPSLGGPAPVAAPATPVGAAPIAPAPTP